MTSWANDGVIRQASLQEVRERTVKGLGPNWINLPGFEKKAVVRWGLVAYRHHVLAAVHK